MSKNPAQVHAIPTDKADINGIIKYNDKWYTYHNLPVIEVKNPYHLYFTTDEEIKEGDWYIDISTNEVIKSEFNWAKLGGGEELRARKIVAATNPDLIEYQGDFDYYKHSIYKIPQDFIQLFVEKQGNIKEVMLEYVTGGKFNTFDEAQAFVPHLKLNSDGSVIWSLPEQKMHTTQELRDACFTFMAVAMLYKENNNNITPQQWLDEHFPQ